MAAELLHVACCDMQAEPDHLVRFVFSCVCGADKRVVQGSLADVTGHLNCAGCPVRALRHLRREG